MMPLCYFKPEPPKTSHFVVAGRQYLCLNQLA